MEILKHAQPQERPIFENLDRLHILPSARLNKKISNAPKKAVASKRKSTSRPPACEQVTKPQKVKASLAAATKEKKVPKKKPSVEKSRFKAFQKVMQPQIISQPKVAPKKEIPSKKATKNEFVTDLEDFFSTPALCFYLVLALFYLGSFYYQPIRDYLWNHPNLQLQTQNPKWVCRSSWLSKISKTSLCDNLEPSYFLFDPKLKTEFQENFEKNPWFKKVKVQHKFPNKIQVLAQIRKPCALVKWNGKEYLVDRDGVRLPYITELTQNLLVLEGVQAPAPEEGKAWQDKGVRFGCQLAQILERNKVSQWIPLDSIQIQNIEGRFSVKTSEIILKTKHQTEIRWGRSELSNKIQLTPTKKLAVLKQFCQKYNELKGIKVADIRFEEESFVCFH